MGKIKVPRCLYNHIFSDERSGKKWKVSNLFKCSRDLLVKRVKLSSIKDECIFEYNPDYKEVSEELKKVMKANLSYPIILSSKGWVMDGNHRVVKARLLGKKTIKAIQFEKDPPPDFVSKKRKKKVKV